MGELAGPPAGRVPSPGNVTYEGQEPSSLLARAITEVLTPDNVYDRPVPPR
jgi:hypothetical protein